MQAIFEVLKSKILTPDQMGCFLDRDYVYHFPLHDEPSHVGTIHLSNLLFSSLDELILLLVSNTIVES